MLINFLDISNFLEIINAGDLIKEIADYIKNHPTDDQLLEALENCFIRKDKDSAPTQDLQFNLGDENHRWKNIYAETFNGTATSAEYADLAEKYTVKGEVKSGDVIVVSDDPNFEGELSNDIISPKVIGVVSEDPGLKMNSKGEGVFVALKGKVKCKVYGNVKKGDILVSYFNGGAISIKNNAYNFEGFNPLGRIIVGIALESAENSLDEFSYIKIII